MRRRLGAEGTSDEELLLRWIVGKEDIDAMRANPRPLEYLNSEQPLVNLLQQLSKRTQNRQIHVQTPGFSLMLEDAVSRRSVQLFKVRGFRGRGFGV